MVGSIISSSAASSGDVPRLRRRVPGTRRAQWDQAGTASHRRGEQTVLQVVEHPEAMRPLVGASIDRRTAVATMRRCQDAMIPASS